MSRAFTTGGTTAAGRVIDVRVWGTRERTGDLTAFQRLILPDRAELVEKLRLRASDRAVLDALPEAEREALYDEAWKAYSVWERPA